MRSNGDFPACLAYLQSLDAAKLDYTDPIWDQNMFEITTFDGSPYLCNTISNPLQDNIDIVIYSKSMLYRANTPTPEEYDAAGKWTWDAFFEICRACKNLGGSVEGGSFCSAENALHAMGGNVYKIENGKIVSGINQNATNAITRFATAWKEGFLGWQGTNGLINGTVGITTAHSWSLKKTGNLMNANWNDIGFYYLPYYNEEAAATGIRPSTGFIKGWGIAKGANEPVAAGIFLREYLDVGNYDISNVFISNDAITFYFNVTTSIDYENWNPYLTYSGLNEAVSGIDYSSDIYSAMYLDPPQVATQMAAVKAAAEKGANNMNDFIERYKVLR